MGQALNLIKESKMKNAKGFYIKSAACRAAEEEEAVHNLRERLSKRSIKSKKAAIEYLRQSSGDFEIPYKIGKYGESDGSFSISSDDPNFEAIRNLLNV